MRERGSRDVTNITYDWVRQVATRKYVWIESLFPFTSFSNFSLQLMHAWIERIRQETVLPLDRVTTCGCVQIERMF